MTVHQPWLYSYTDGGAIPLYYTEREKSMKHVYTVVRILCNWSRLGNLSPRVASGSQYPLGSSESISR